MSEAVVSYLDYPVYSASSDGSLVLTSGGGGGKDYGIEDQLEAHALDPETKKVFTVDSSTAGSLIDSLNYNEHVELFCGCSQGDCVLVKVDPASGLRVVSRFGCDTKGPSRRLIVARFSPTGEYVVSGGEDKVVRVWKIALGENPGAASEAEPEGVQTATATLVAEMHGHEGDVRDCAMSPDNELVVSCGGDAKLFVWHWREGRVLYSQSLFNPRNKTEKLTVRCCRFLSNQPGVATSGKRLIAVACCPRGPSFVIGWSVTFGANETHQQTKKEDDTPSTGSTDNTDSFSMVKVCEVCCEESAACCQLAVSPNEQRLAIGFATGKCIVLDRGLNVLAQHAAHDLPTTGVCFVGDLLVSTSADYSLVVLDPSAKSQSRLVKLICGFVFVMLLVGGILGIFLQHIAFTGYTHFIARQEALMMGDVEVTLSQIIRNSQPYAETLDATQQTDSSEQSRDFQHSSFENGSDTAYVASFEPPHTTRDEL